MRGPAELYHECAADDVGNVNGTQSWITKAAFLAAAAARSTTPEICQFVLARYDLSAAAADADACQSTLACRHACMHDTHAPVAATVWSLTTQPLCAEPGSGQTSSSGGTVTGISASPSV